MKFSTFRICHIYDDDDDKINVRKNSGELKNSNATHKFFAVRLENMAFMPKTHVSYQTGPLYSFRNHFCFLISFISRNSGLAYQNYHFSLCKYFAKSGTERALEQKCNAKTIN